MREIVSLICSECKRKNYFTTRNKKGKKEKIEVNKYCPSCHKHILHKEGKS
ncbi:MAG: 50S ribosomal protein L33 [Candidatus Omnitrophica bacterium]|nr:50S ribosomal protein L33 [Candidatus Omnitrophota bacterium]MCM8777480.1 50S ribosomal protein L33 [Candidatus Omnitrophota bacterium]